MILHSDYSELCPVNLPYAGRQLYMHTFSTYAPSMRPGYEDYLGPVMDLCAAAGYEGVAHMTVDEKVLGPGQTQRRPHPHVDGRFFPIPVGAWSTSGWLHGCNNVAARGKMGRMRIIVASSVPGCMAWRGDFEGEPKDGGDLSHLDLPEGELLEAGRGYLLTPDCVHESLPMTSTVERTFLRIALED